MNARLTIYLRPENRGIVMRDVERLIGKSPIFFSTDNKFLSWIGESELDVASSEDGFLLEREIQSIQGIIDAEIIPEETIEEDAINEKFGALNKVINFSKTNLPDPSWYHRTLEITGALKYAVAEFEAGRGSFDQNLSKMPLALIDTGYSNHPETHSINYIEGRNFMRGENPDDPLDTLESTRPLPIRWGGHGTSCAGLILGKNSVIPPENRIPREDCYFDDRVNGLLPVNIDLIPFRVSRNIISFSSRMANAINYIKDEGKIRIISMSHASLLNRPIYYAATREAYERGIMIIAAPGSHVFASRKVFTYPARYDETIAPAASTINNEPWRLTHGGPEVELCAPGFEMYIPWPFKTNDNRLGYVYKWSEGSSFAVPIVATAAALWKMHHGNRLDKFSGIETIELFRQIIKKTVTPFSSDINTKLYGTGIINFRNMLECPLNLERRMLKSQIKVKPEDIFKIDKTNSSFIRELSYIRLKELSAAVPIPGHRQDLYYDMASEPLKKWLDSKLQNTPDKSGALQNLIGSKIHF